MTAFMVVYMITNPMIHDLECLDCELRDQLTDGNIWRINIAEERINFIIANVVSCCQIILITRQRRSKKKILRGIFTACGLRCHPSLHLNNFFLLGFQGPLNVEPSRAIKIDNRRSFGCWFHTRSWRIVQIFAHYIIKLSQKPDRLLVFVPPLLFLLLTGFLTLGGRCSVSQYQLYSYQILALAS